MFECLLFFAPPLTVCPINAVKEGRSVSNAYAARSMHVRTVLMTVEVLSIVHTERYNLKGCVMLLLHVEILISGGDISSLILHCWLSA